VVDVAPPQKPLAAAPGTAESRVVALPVQVSAPGSTRTASGTVTKSRVQILDRAETRRDNRPELLLRVGRADGVQTAATVSVAVDYSTFRTAAGGDFGNRLRLVALPECALSTPDRSECQGTPLPSRNNGTTVTGEVSAPGTPRPGTLLAVQAAPEGSTGDFKATSLDPSGKWQAGGSSGGFAWSLPMRMPPSLGGPAPELSLGYAAQSVDGRTATSNNQPSWIGEGWGSWSGFVERQYRACTDDTGNGASNTPATPTGDRCWATDNATLSLNGKTVELIRDGASGTFRPKVDDGSRIERLTKATFDTGNGDNDGEHWKVTTTDGMQYWFGRNRLPGWASGKPETNSTWTVPVFGNHAGEPCRGASFAASWCHQAWRWNLDYVVDTHGNSMSYRYGKETNKYARAADVANVTEYTRGGWLARIDYGTRTESEFGTAPMQVVFDTADRCESNCATHNATTWKDTPWDLECTGSLCAIGTPTFWTAKRLAKVTTKVGGRDVESWTLRHTYPDPGDNTRAGLWLAGVTHTGLVGGTSAMPEVTFTGQQMDNRVDTADLSPPMKWWRVASIRTETGGEIKVSYSAPECAAGGTMPGAPESNTLRCFPVKWTPPGGTKPATDYFHKYVTTAVSEDPRTTDAPIVSTAYEYVGGAAWHYADDDGLATEDGRTWSDWRGYAKVRVTKGVDSERTSGEFLYFRGMDGDRLPTGTRSVTVTDSQNGMTPDADGLEGRVREQITRDGPGGTEIGGVITDPWMSAPTATRTAAGRTVYARYVDDGAVHTRVALDGGRGYRRTRTVTSYDEYGLEREVFDAGDTATGADDRCTRTTYARDPGSGLVALVARVETWARPCDQPATSEADVIGDRRTSYDGQPWGAAPTNGDATRVEEIATWSGGTPGYVTTARSQFDAYGRVTASWDARGAQVTTQHTPATGGPLTGKTETNALGHKTITTFEPGWGMPSQITDPNDRTTSLGYDPLGRLTGVWQPGRVKGAAPASSIFEYRIATDAPVVVTTSTLHSDRVGYLKTYEIYDGLLRRRQTQTPSLPGQRLVADIFYDSTSRARKTNDPYPTTGAPGGSLLLVTDESQIPSQTVTTFDGADRPTTQVLRSYGIEKSRMTTRYGGDHVDLTPPTGGTATSTFTDARNRTVELRQYASPTPTGGYDATRYTYTKGDLLASVTDPAGNTWTHAYDLRGRETGATDPDKGTNATTYNDAGDVTSVTMQGRTLAFSYDALGRRTGSFDGTTSGARRASWTYDTVASGKGRPASRSRWDGGLAYTTAVTGYDAGYRPLGVRITIPASPGVPPGLAGSYEFANTYNHDGSLATATYPAVGGLASETVSYEYDALGKPAKLAGRIDNRLDVSYVTDTAYTNFGLPGVFVFAASATSPLLETESTYDPATKRPAGRKSTRETAPSTLTDVRYTYDPAGNVREVADMPAGGPADTQCFGYDHLRRLTESWTPRSGDCGAAPSNGALGGPEPYWQSYTFDKVGNRTTRVEHATPTGDVTTSYAYPAPGAAQPHALNATTTADTSGVRTVSYGYDGGGNTISRPGTNGEQKLTWDVEGHLASTSDGTGTSSYLYDADGSRLIRRDPAGATLFLPNTEVRRTAATGTVTATRFYQHGETLVAQRTAAGVAWLITDWQGTAGLAVDAGTQQVAQRRFTPFGEVRGSTGAWPNEVGFVAGGNEPGGLTNVGLRQYDAETGRFISDDPVEDPGDPQQLHGYAYANSSPVSFSDPSGLFAQGPDGECLRFCPYKPGHNPKTNTAADREWNRKYCKSGEYWCMAVNGHGPNRRCADGARSCNFAKGTLSPWELERRRKTEELRRAVHDQVREFGRRVGINVDGVLKGLDEMRVLLDKMMIRSGSVCMEGVLGAGPALAFDFCMNFDWNGVTASGNTRRGWIGGAEASLAVSFKVNSVAADQVDAGPSEYIDIGGAVGLGGHGGAALSVPVGSGQTSFSIKAGAGAGLSLGGWWETEETWNSGYMTWSQAGDFLRSWSLRPR
jgi:RHS repeat-associated protein